ncbi:MAG TPA: GntR family transcriptional regulator [Spirochaetota bacterium]|nr:GntR family transcriptional regulator [Spirochaetota bacterium]
MFTKIDKTNLNDEISRQMISRILNGVLQPGDKLPPEREMAEQMNVNRNTLREALRRLELLGLLTVRQGDGIYTLDYRDSGSIELIKHILISQKEKTAEIIYDVLKIRTLVIPEMAALAAEKISGDELTTLLEITNDPQKTLIEKDLAIHRSIAHISGNLFFMIFLNFFNEIFRQYAQLYFSFEENRNVSIKFHKNIIDALNRKDSKKAKSIMLDVLVYAEERMIDYMEKTDEKG